jgi:hypothetical protein
MTSQDTKNLSILQDYIDKCWGLKSEDNAYLKERIFNPVIVPEYRNLNIDENFRAIYDFDVKNISSLSSFQKENDKGWAIFSRCFYFAKDKIGITYENYLDNKILIGKNEVKLKKIIEKLYNENFEIFKAEFKREYLPLDCNLRNTPKQDLRKEDISEYIIKIFEVIGKYKTSTKKMKLVISFNYADWLLCSAEQCWSSCLNIERGEYWYGMPTLFGDDNRALLYITDGTKKNWNGIEVDSLSYRAWVLLNERNNKVISKFYPTSPINDATIREVTNDKNFIGYSGSADGVSSKYKLKPICIKKDHLYITVYNDIVSLNESKFTSTGDLFYRFGTRGGRQIVNFKLKQFGVVKGKSTFSSSLSRYKDEKRTINQDFYSYCCTKCGKQTDTFEVKDESLCEDCLGEDYYKCNLCGNFHKKTDKTKTFKGKFICDYCYSERLTTCSICGNLEDIREMISLEDNGRILYICGSCFKTNVVSCKRCGKNMLIKNKKYFIDKTEYVCETCFYTNPEYKNKIVCSIGKEILETEDAVFDYKEIAYCEKCLAKERDKKQTFFEF